MKEFQEGNITANGIRQHFYRTTPEAPRLSVLLLHGITDNGLCWARVADQLGEDYDVIMPDARGHGYTDSPESGYTVADRATDVAGLITALKLERPVVIGHSMGAMTAAAVSSRYPAPVRGVVLEDPAWFSSPAAPPEPDAQAKGADSWYQRVAQQKAMTKEALIAYAREDHPNWSAEELGPWAEAKQQVDLKAFRASRHGSATRPWDETARLIRCQVLLIYADREEGGIVTPEVAEQASAFWKKGRLLHLAGAGHNIRRDAFEPYMDGVKAFLKELE